MIYEELIKGLTKWSRALVRIGFILFFYFTVASLNYSTLKPKERGGSECCLPLVLVSWGVEWVPSE